MSVKSITARVESLQATDVLAWRKDLSVNIVITTACNRYCASCCYKGIVRKDNARHFLAEDVAATVIAVGDVGIVYLLGGEPTLHPDFENVMKEARNARGAQTLRLVTNGARLVQHAAATKYVDRVILSLLGDAAGFKICKEFERIKPASVDLERKFTVHYDLGGGATPCSNLYNTVSVLDSKVYPCCVACGIAGAQSTPLQVGWEQALLAIEAPCEKCFNSDSTRVS